MLARVYQVMAGNVAGSSYWQKAEEAANAAYGGNVAAALAPARYGEGFDDISNPEWIWGMPQSGDQSNYYWNAPSAFSDHNAPAYYATYVNATFVNEFSDTDVRNTFVNLYNHPAGDWREYVTTKFTFAFDSDIVIMRTAEMILIESEALFWQGNESDAHNLLYALQVNRDPSAVKSSNSGQALLEEILLERRKELYMEMGVEWFDAKRLSRGIARDAHHRIVKTLEPNDKRFYLKVPQAEIDANDAIDDSVNANR